MKYLIASVIIALAVTVNAQVPPEIDKEILTSVCNARSLKAVDNKLIGLVQCGENLLVITERYSTFTGVRFHKEDVLYIYRKVDGKRTLLYEKKSAKSKVKI